MRTSLRSWIAGVAAGAVLSTLCVTPEVLAADAAVVLRPDRVWTEGEPVHSGWVVAVQGNHIVGVGPEKSVTVPQGAQVIDLPGTTLLPGLMDIHSHLFLHPYNETL